MSDCIFCRIVAGEISADVVWTDDQALAFRDLNPQAPVHVLIIPHKHIAGIAHAGPHDAALLGHCLIVAREIALREGLAEGGYRLVINSGADAGETVPHLHIHLLGGRRLTRLAG